MKSFRLMIKIITWVNCNRDRHLSLIERLSSCLKVMIKRVIRSGYPTILLRLLILFLKSTMIHLIRNYKINRFQKLTNLIEIAHFKITIILWEGKNIKKIEKSMSNFKWELLNKMIFLINKILNSNNFLCINILKTHMRKKTIIKNLKLLEMKN